MKNLNYLSIPFFCFSIFLIATGCKNEEKQVVTYRANQAELKCMEYIINKDDSLGKVRNYACEKIPLSNTIEQYVTSVQELDFSNCPGNFSLAFENHINAWEAMKQVTNHFPNLRGEMHDLFDTIAQSEHKNTFDPLLKEIWDSWASVENAMYDGKHFNLSFIIDEPDLIPEGIAHNPVDNSFYIGSTWKRKILKIDSAGSVSDFVESGQDGLLGVIGMRVDTVNQILWVCTSSAGSGMPVNGLTELTDNKSGIFKYDLKTKKILAQFWLEKEGESYFFNDIAVNKNGHVFATEMNTKSIYTIEFGTNKLKHFYTLPDGYTANGIDIDKEGDNLFIALYSQPNVFGKINIETKELNIISIPEEENVGADGLYFYKNSLIAVQPFTENRSISQYILNDQQEAVEKINILLSDDQLLDQPTTGTIAKDKFYVIANSQLQSFSKQWKENQGEVDLTKLQAVKILEIDLPDK